MQLAQLQVQPVGAEGKLVGWVHGVRLCLSVQRTFRLQGAGMPNSCSDSQVWPVWVARVRELTGGIA